jgi:hypothetical protein
MKKMKLLNINSKISVILLICLFVLIIIPIIFEITGYKEMMTDYVNFSDYNTIDRIQVNNTGSSPAYSYCVGGTVKCPNSNSALIDVSNTDYKDGKTYKSTCNDGSDVICTDNLFNSVVSYNLPYYTLPGGTSFPLSTKNKGFTEAYGYVPVGFDSSNNINIYNDSKTIMERIHKCNLLSNDYQSNCYNKFFMGNTNSSNNNTTSTTTSNIADSTKCGTSDKIPCLADYGTNVGESLCCGQTGVLQNTKYVCPSTRPKCANFKCGSQFGNCE